MTFDAQIRIEVIDLARYRYRVRIPIRMNNSPLMWIGLRTGIEENSLGEAKSFHEIKVGKFGTEFRGEFDVPVTFRGLDPFIQVYYQGPDDPCGTVAFKKIS